MGKKYFTLNFDDGLEQDKRIIALMKKYGLQGTFNLNGGMLGEQGETKGIGSFPLKDLPAGTVHSKFFSYVAHNRIPADEIKDVYADVEIGSHGFRHGSMGKMSDADMRAEIDQDLQALETLTGRKIVSHAYAYGSASPETVTYLKEKGMLHARMIMPSNGFAFPEEPLMYRPSGMLCSGSALKLVRKFRETAAGEEDMLLCLWGHGYELDYGSANHSWEHLERVFQAIAGAEDIEYVTCGEAFLRHAQNV